MNDLIRLVRLERIKTQLAAMARVEDVKEVLDKAEAVRAYHKRAGACIDIINNGGEIRIRSERRAGKLISEMPKQHGSRGTGKKVGSTAATTLSALGVSKTQSSRWQKLASVPANEFESYIATTKASQRELTTAGAMRLAKQHTNGAKAPVPDCGNKIDRQKFLAMNTE